MLKQKTSKKLWISCGYPCIFSAIRGILVKKFERPRGDPVRSLCQEDPLEKEMATRSSILAWEILWTEEPGGLQCTGLQELDRTERLSMHTHCLDVLGQRDGV